MADDSYLENGYFAILRWILSDFDDML